MSPFRLSQIVPDWRHWGEGGGEIEKLYDVRKVVLKTDSYFKDSSSLLTDGGQGRGSMRQSVGSGYSSGAAYTHQQTQDSLRSLLPPESRITEFLLFWTNSPDLSYYLNFYLWMIRFSDFIFQKSRTVTKPQVRCCCIRKVNNFMISAQTVKSVVCKQK